MAWVPLNPLGSKLVPVTPVPLHVPPVEPVISVFKLRIPLLEQSVVGVHVAFEEDVMEIV